MRAPGASSTTRGPTAPRAIRSTTGASTGSATGCSSARCWSSRSPASCSRACGSPWTIPATAAPVRRLDRRPGASTGAERVDARGVCATASGGSTACWRSSFVASDPLHEGRATCSPSYVSLSCATPWPASGCAPIPPERADGARRLRHARRLQPAAPAAARRLHEVRQVPRGVPGQRHRAARCRRATCPRAARAGARAADGRSGSAACSAPARPTARPTATASPPASSRRGRRPRRDGLVVHAVQRLRGDLPGRDRAGADHQPAAPPPGRGGRARLQPAVDAGGDPQVGELVRREPAQARQWAKELDFEVKDARKEQVDVLWFVGDYASFDPRSQQVTRALAAAAAPRRSRLRDPLRRRAQLGQRRPPGGRGGPLRVARRAQHGARSRSAISTGS